MVLFATYTMGDSVWGGSGKEVYTSPCFTRTLELTRDLPKTNITK
jgi:hypothetical protein